jgi:hypothetical protein
LPLTATIFRKYDYTVIRCLVDVHKILYWQYLVHSYGKRVYAEICTSQRTSRIYDFVGYQISTVIGRFFYSQKDHYAQLIHSSHIAKYHMNSNKYNYLFFSCAIRRKFKIAFFFLTFLSDSILFQMKYE